MNNTCLYSRYIVYLCVAPNTFIFFNEVNNPEKYT